MTSRTLGIFLATVLTVLAGARVASAQRGGRGGMVGGRGGGARPSTGGSPSFSGPAARPTPQPSMNIPNRPNPGNVARPAPSPLPSPSPSPGRPTTLPAGGVNRPNPGTQPAPGIGERPPFGGIGGVNRPSVPGNRPGGGLVGSPPPGANRPGQISDQLGISSRPNVGNTVVNRPNVGNTVVNRPTNITNVNINRQTNINTNINNINNVTRVNQAAFGPGYGGAWPARFPSYHRGWVNGSWNGNYHPGWGWNSWSNPLAWGVGIGVAAWGVGSLLNSWGYSSFANPYLGYSSFNAQQPAVVVQQPIVYDYSRPLNPASASPAPAAVDQAVAILDNARAAFRSGDYAQALTLADQAIQQTPNDPVLHEFRALCLFAMGRYSDAAVPMYAVLSSGPGWDWTTLINLYPNPDVYTQQLRSLEAYCQANPQAASARFVLASLYMTQGSIETAAGMFQQVVALQPQDRLSAQLVEALSPRPSTDQAQVPTAPQPPSTGTPAAAAAPAPDQPAPSQAPGAGGAGQGPPLPTNPVPARLLGNWAANPAKDVGITLTMTPDKNFIWKVSNRGQSNEFRGEATFDNDVLALVPPDQPPMVGKVTWKDDGHFQFQALGGPPDDPGLAFGK
jgi:tetratricopeptide (TPR) repeat protein